MCGQRLSTACTSSPSANRHSTRPPTCTTRRPASRNSASEAARTRCSVPVAAVDAMKGRYNLKYGLSQAMPEELTIGEAAARSGVAPSALRFYEAEGLIEARRTDGNQRRYERATLRRIALIQAGKAAGIPLEEIRAALSRLPDGRTPTRRDWERLS